jgi:hypothetical protein
VSARRAVWLLLAIEVAFTLLDFLLGPHATVAPEERFNARSGVQIACGHIGSLWDLQYRSGCGGCSAEAVISAPLFRALGPSVAVWKLVPAAFHIGVAVAGAALAIQLAGQRAAIAFLMLLLAAPTAYREVVLTGWGNHGESSALALLALFAVVRSAGASEPRRRIAWAFAAGLVGGAGVWFAYTSLHILPALLLTAGLMGVGPVIALLVGMNLGFSPWWLHRLSQPGGLDDPLAGADWISLAPAGELTRWLATDFARGGLWPHPSSFHALSALWWVLLLALAAVGLYRLVYSAKRAKGPKRAVALVLPLTLGALLLAYALRYDLWADSLPLQGYDAFEFRYRAPLLPLLMLCAAIAVARAGHAQVRPAVIAALLLLTTCGLFYRVSAWTGPRLQTLSQPVYGFDSQPDRTVPTGEPRQRLAREQHRRVDIEAAIAFLGDHNDALTDCRLAHARELGRRIALSDVRWREALKAQGATSEDIAAVEQGIAWTTAKP